MPVAFVEQREFVWRPVCRPHGATPGVRACDVCGTEFVPQRVTQLRCGPECTRAGKRAQKRERYATDPEYRERKRARNRELNRERYATDPEYRERHLERNRERYATDPEYRERIRERIRERYATDPEYRERHLERNRERYATDPEYRERHLERNRERCRQRKQFELWVALSQLLEKTHERLVRSDAKQAGPDGRGTAG